MTGGGGTQRGVLLQVRPVGVNHLVFLIELLVNRRGVNVNVLVTVFSTCSHVLCTTVKHRSIIVSN